MNTNVLRPAVTSQGGMRPPGALALLMRQRLRIFPPLAINLPSPSEKPIHHRWNAISERVGNAATPPSICASGVQLPIAFRHGESAIGEVDPPPQKTPLSGH